MIETPKVNDQSLIYMYGLSDFWSDIFGDTQLVESILASTTTSLAEVYSYFLQRAAGVSLSDISDRYQTRIKLLLLDESSSLDNEGTLFPISGEFDTSSKISNRPILPTQTLDNDVHYEVIDDTIQFYKPLKDLKFPVRYTSDGSTQYALWLVDVEVDENWIDESFGRLVGFTEEDAIFNYKSFLEGVYYLYSNGPNIAFIEKGVNLAMGIPYARATEEVLSIAQDAVTGNWVVFTDTQAYELPYGYSPDISVGDVISENEVLTSWVEVRDYHRSGEWWYNIYIPKEVLGGVSQPSDVGICREGSTGDKMMQTFLRHHMFEVLVTQPNGDDKSFKTALDLVMYSKPAYTYPIFVWRAPLDDEIFTLDDEEFIAQPKVDLTEDLIYTPSISAMDRADDNTPFVRGVHHYNRVQSSSKIASLLGYGDWDYNAGWAPEFSGVDERTQTHLEALSGGRDNKVSPIGRGEVFRGWRGRSGEIVTDGLEWVIRGDRVIPQEPESITIRERDLTPLHMMSTEEFLEKVRSLHPDFSINADDFVLVLKGLNLRALYNSLIIRDESVLDELEGSRYTFTRTKGILDPILSDFAKQSYVPKLESLADDDTGSLFFSKNTESTWSVQIVTSDWCDAPYTFPVMDSDDLEAVSSYDQSILGNTFLHKDTYIYPEQTYVDLPVVSSSEGSFIPVVDNKVLPPSEYVISGDGKSLTLSDPVVTLGYLSWVPYSGDSREVETDGDTYWIPELISSNEEVWVIYEDEFSNTSILLEYIVELDDIAGSNLILDEELPVGGTLYLTFANKGSAFNEETLSPASGVYTIQDGYSVKILVDGRVLSDREYTVKGVDLSLTSGYEGDITVRYYEGISYTLHSSFTRGSVKNNESRALRDRSRINGEYNDGWDGSGSSTVYLNRGGRAFKEVPALGDTPVYADSINVIRKL